MKPLLRILRATATILSLLLLLWTALLWPRSYYVADGISYGRNGYSPIDGSLIRRIRGLQVSRGQLEIASGQISSMMFPHISPRDEGFNISHDLSPTATDSKLIVWSHLGFSEMRLQSSVFDIRAVFIPFWSLSLLFALLPSIWLIKFLRRRRRLATNHCPACGYDLRASPDRCPECGAAPAISGPSPRLQ